MKKTIRTILARLDGKPENRRGQSMVELALTTPILLIMLLGLVEIGWLANHYLTLIDTTRSAGRYGSVRDPLETWASGNERHYHYMDCDVFRDRFDRLTGDIITIWTDAGMADLSTYGFTVGDEFNNELQYFDSVACSVLANLSPLVFDNSLDEIAISVFSYAVLDQPGGEKRVKITGRYPPRNNECWEDAHLRDNNGNFVRSGGSYIETDPFLLFEDVTSDLADWSDDARYGSTDYVDYVRGFIWTGHHEVSDQQDVGARPCLGSEFSTYEFEQLLNETLLDPHPIDEDAPAISAEELEELPNGGLVLVEIFWNHRQLLGLPLFRLVGDPTELHVWSIFPVAGAVPDETRIQPNYTPRDTSGLLHPGP